MAGLPSSVKKSIEDTKVEYKQLGTSGLRVSVPILGAMSFGDPGWMDWILGEQDALPILKAAYDMGVNSWDTANVYSNGASEEVIGKAIKKYAIPRQKLVIMTKCFSTVGEEKSIRSTSLFPISDKSKDYVNQWGLSRQAILTAVDASLKRLDTTYIDLLQIHRFDASVPIEETMSTLHSLVLSGKVRYIGASSMWTHQFALMQFCAEKNGWTKFVSMQNHYNLMYREEEREMNKFCNLTGVGLIPWGPLAAGKLARPLEGTEDTRRAQYQNRHSAATSSISMSYGLTEADEKIIGRVKELADRKGWTMSQVVLTWLNARVTSPIIGFSSIQRIEDALASRGKILAEDEQRFLEELYIDKPISGHV
ncbi:hypothetical protein ACLMJK_002898 [Lecanora helva]